ncbi:MAG: histidine phosphotransferase family protein [Acetobacteraceae bacterium]
MAAEAAEAAGADLTVSSNEALRLAEVLCARLCHDVAGSLGALIGSLELATEKDGGMVEEALELASATGRALAARLRLLRAAWAGTDAPLDLPTLVDLARGLPRRRLELDLSAMPSGTEFDPATGRVVLNLVLLAAEALPAGGRVWLERTEESLLIGVNGAHSAWPAALGTALVGPAKIEGPRELQAPLTVLLARAGGFSLSLLMPAGPSLPAGAPPLVLRMPAGCALP